MQLLYLNVFIKMFHEKLSLNDRPDHFPHLCHSNSQVPVPVFVQVITNLPGVLIGQLPVIYAYLVMAVLDRHD